MKRFQDWDYWGRPIPGFGVADAKLLIVGLAPAAHGGNRTGRMFTGDSSGDWLYAALHRHGFANQPSSVSRDDGLELIDCYIAAAARCAPPDNKPTQAEFDACRPFLEAELRLLTAVRVVITLGALGHDSFLKASGMRAPFGHGTETVLPNGMILISSYHPSRQNTNTGRLTAAMWDAIFQRARNAVSATSSRDASC